MSSIYHRITESVQLNIEPIPVLSSSSSSDAAPYTYTLFSFTPPANRIGGEFFEADFPTKLTILVEVIQKVRKILENEIPDPFHKNIFAAPEYLFSDFSKNGRHCYYSQSQKNKFKNTVLEISKEIDLIIAPGTFRWWNGKETGALKFRNNLYMFYRGTVQHYNKHQPHRNYDFQFYSIKGYTTCHYEFLRLYWKGRRAIFHRKPEQPSVFEIAGIKIGVEICYDNVVRELNKYLIRNPEIKIDLFLFVSDGISYDKAHFPYQEKPYVTIHVDRFLQDRNCGYRSIARVCGPQEPTISPIRNHYIFDASDSQADFQGVSQELTKLFFKTVPPAPKKYYSLYPLIEELLDAHEIERAIKEAQAIMEADFTVCNLTMLFELFISKRSAVPFFTAVLSLPVKYQDSKEIRSFYQVTLPRWLGKSLQSDGCDLFLSVFCTAIANSGSSTIALAWANAIQNPLIKFKIKEAIKRV